jgi:intracellular septation protein A
VIPRVAEATLIPSTIFYVVWHVLGVWPALISALVWAAAVTLRRFVRTRRVPALVVIGAAGLCLRTLVSAVSGSTFFYFLQPVLGTIVISVTFFASVAVGRPLVRRLAAEFCPLSDEVSNRRGIQSLFRDLTLLWGLVLLANATATLVILLTLSPDTFVATKSVMTPGLTISATAITVVWAIRVAKREGLVPIHSAVPMPQA